MQGTGRRQATATTEGEAVTKLAGILRNDDGTPVPVCEAFNENDIERFWGKTSLGRFSLDRCNVWEGAIGSNGYGEFRICRENTRHRYRCHRVAYELATGETLTEDDVIRHTCDNPKCVNPKHLLKGTHKDNVADRVERDRSAKGSSNGRAKLTEAGVAIARYCMTELGVTPWMLGKVTGMDPKVFSQIRDGVTWRAA